MRKIFLVLFAVSIYISGSGQIGFPDLSFGTNGYISSAAASNGRPSFQTAKAGFIDANGKILLALQVGNKTVINKRLPSGLPDLTYGKNSFSAAVSLIVTSAAMQADGKIVVAGTPNGSDDFMLARYNTDGELDPSFGNAGVIIAYLGSSIEFLTSVAITSKGDIIAGGGTQVNGVDHFTLVRFTANGMLDHSFGNNSISITDFGQPSLINKIALQADGKIVATGTVGSSTGGDFAIARYNEDGSPDLTFNFTGRTSADFGYIDRANAITMDPGGKIYVGGNSLDISFNRHFRVARFNADGQMDLTYNGGSGSVSTVGNSDDVLTNIILQIDGTIIASGHTNLNTASYDIEIIHINEDGKIDKNFANNGLLLAGSDTQSDESSFLIIDANGKMLTGGSSTEFVQPAIFRFSCFRFNADGTPDLGFGNKGVLQDFLPNGYYAYNALFVQADGKLLAASESNDQNGSAIYLSRFDATGKPDNTYGQNGIKALGYESGTSFFQPDGKLLRTSYSPTNNGDIVLLRYNVDGSPDAGFGSGGRVITDLGGLESTGPVAFQADGKIIMGGFSRDAKGTDWLIVRYNSDGSIDGSFGTSGFVRKDNMIEENIQSICITPTGQIVLGGTGFTYPPDFSYLHFDILIARLNPDGSFDKSFGNQGTLIIDRGNNEYLGALTVQDDGKVLFTYGISGASINENYVERLNADGTNDFSFGQSGKIVSGGTAITLQADQKILVSGTLRNNQNNAQFSLSRFSRDGNPDTSFGNNGKTLVSFAALDNNLYTNLLAGNSFFASGSGVDKWGGNIGIIAKFSLAPTNLTCVKDLVIQAGENSCSAKVYSIDPSPACSGENTIYYKLTGATTGNGTCSASGRSFNKGVTTVTYSIGRESNVSCSFTVTVLDKQLPAIRDLKTNISTLWPPDHKMKDIIVNYSVSDNCGIAKTEISVTSNEPVSVNAGDPSPDWQIIDNHHIMLRSERLDNGNGRVYTIRVITTDISGNQNAKTVFVTVPKKTVPDCKLDIDVAPNPSNSYFQVTFKSSCEGKTAPKNESKIKIKIYNNNGSLIARIDDVQLNSVLHIGGKYLPGIYYLEANVNDTLKTVKLIKQ
ncbi:MAG: T9SS type A sorting domain-containing protein [Ferruginibacter sp.]